MDQQKDRQEEELISPVKPRLNAPPEVRLKILLRGRLIAKICRRACELVPPRILSNNNVGVLGEGGAERFHLAFGEMIAALRARTSSSSALRWPPGLSLPTPAVEHGWFQSRRARTGPRRAAAPFQLRTPTNWYSNTNRMLMAERRETPEGMSRLALSWSQRSTSVLF